MGRFQFQVLLNYMEMHSLFARGQIPKLGPQGHQKFKKMWFELACRLNLIGPCKKTLKDGRR